MDINSLYLKFKDIEFGDLTKNHKNELKTNLSGYSSDDILTIDDHKKYLTLLSTYRQLLIDNLEDYGKNFKDLVKALLSVGEDGVYSSSLRFLFELIQNVDDCYYSDSSKCILNIKFDTLSDEIILTYNETGFTPFNVFAITGIAEEAKNIDANKIEIGEKGIGFKSVFGIANSVLIESGLFAFELSSSNFIVPKTRYDGFSGIEGTRLTLKLKPGLTQGIYREFAGRYSKSDVLFTKNPLLFLNKLTDIKFYIDDSFRYLKFHVKRASTTPTEKTIEENVLVSVDIKDEDNKRTKKEEINCLRYTIPIVYNRNACVSRYSTKTKYQDKKHNIIAIIPYPDELTKSGNTGALYSFLPTQIMMNVPIALHVPYKLDSSREFVDPQNENEWFTHTNNELYAFFKWVYLDLASRVKEMIISYLPRKNECFFNRNNEKVKCLQKECFKGQALLEEKLFYSTDGTLEKASDIISFGSDEKIEDPKKIHSLLAVPKKLFIPAKNTDMKLYGVEVLKEAYLKLFIRSLCEPKTTDFAFEILSKLDDSDFRKALETDISVCLTVQQIEAIFKYEKISDAFKAWNKENIIAGKRPLFGINEGLSVLDDKNSEILNGVLVDIESKRLELYLSLINQQFVIASGLPCNSYFAGSKSLLLSAEEPLTAFACFAEQFGTDTLGANLKIREESEKLNSYAFDDGISASDYLKLLSKVRKRIKDCFGTKVYNNYIKLINASGVDEYRFINELLQNADDCDYSYAVNNNKLPSFKCNINGALFTTRYNENGFEKENVRSITAIGESTKKQIQSNSTNSTIGEKGVGFKSVFTVASEVTIHSNGFHFMLTEKEPTIPQMIDKNKNISGTKMVFKLKPSVSNISFSEESVLSVCASLRNLKRLTLGDYKVEIDDSDSTRRKVYINGNEYTFLKFEYGFIVANEDAIKERENNQRIISKHQKIVCYIPEKNNSKSKLNVFYLYSGLPTLSQMNIPLIIDAPFEVTTSREGINQSLWNSIVRDEVYNALINMLHKIKVKEKNEIFRFVNETGLFKDNAWLNISENYLHDRISKEKLVLLTDGSYAAPYSGDLWIYSDLCFFIFRNKMATVPEGNIIETPKHLRTLEWLGCKRKPLREIICLIKEAVKNGNINNTTFRNNIYQFLKDKTKEINENPFCKNLLGQLPIVPAKPISGSEPTYITCDNKIYTSSDNYSTDEYYILDEKLLSKADFNEIFRKDIQVMDDKQKGMLYWDKIANFLSNNKDKKQIASFLLNEFHNNKRLLSLRKNELQGFKSRIPFLYADGEYYIGNAFINTTCHTFTGTVLKKMIVSSEYRELAEFLGYESIKKITYGDFVREIATLSTDDVEDILFKDLDNREDIIRRFIADRKVPSELIEEYNLGHYISSDGIDKNEYDFPTHKVKNIEGIHNDVIFAELNKITNKVVHESKRLPAFEFPESEKRGYALEEYRPANGNDVHFCQMCQKPTSSKYIQVNSIVFEPTYAWKQMRLCLCLEHGKDFESLRKKEDIITKFINEIRKADILDDEPIAIPIDNRKVYFTATHLAYIQEIIKREERLGAENIQKELLEV